MDDDFKEALEEFRRKLATPQSTGGDAPDRDERLDQITDQLQELSKLLGKLEESLTASALAGDKESAELDPEIRAMLEKND